MCLNFLSPPLKSWHLLYKASRILQFICALFSLCVGAAHLEIPTYSLCSRERERERRKMATNCKVSFGVFSMFSFVFAIFLPAVQGQHFAPAPSPTSDGTTVDQGIACFLMLLALVLTYLIHAFDSPLVV